MYVVYQLLRIIVASLDFSALFDLDDPWGIKTSGSQTRIQNLAMCGSSHVRHFQESDIEKIECLSMHAFNNVSQLISSFTTFVWTSTKRVSPHQVKLSNCSRTQWLTDSWSFQKDKTVLCFVCPWSCIMYCVNIGYFSLFSLFVLLILQFVTQ